jgi:hypothetical protein
MIRFATPPVDRASGWRNQSLVRERDGRRARFLGRALVCMVMLGAPIGVYVYQQMLYSRVQYDIDALRKTHDRFVQAEMHLREHRARLESLARVESVAPTLGLAPPVPEKVLVVEVGQTPSRNLMARVEGPHVPGR